MNQDKKMQLALTLADAAEGLQTMSESMKLVASALDDAANLLRGAASDEEEDPAPLEWGTPDWGTGPTDWGNSKLDWGTSPASKE